MVFTSTKSRTDIWESADYNAFVDFTQSISSNLLTWKKISGLSDITPSTATGGQALIWNTSLSKYIPSTQAISDVVLSNLTIDGDKDWGGTYGVNDIVFLSSQSLSGTIRTKSILLPDTDTRIYKIGEDLTLEADDDIMMNPDDDITIQCDGNSYARFGGHEKGFYINKNGVVSQPTFALEVIGGIKGDGISGTKISGGTIIGTWNGDVVATAYIESSAKYSNIHASGDKYTNTYNWMVNSGSQYTNILESGAKYTIVYAWMIASGTKYNSAYESGQTAMYSIVQADDIDDGIGGGWTSAAFANSGIKWDGTNWVPMPSGGSGGGGGTPGGTYAGDVQYRVDASTFGGENAFNYDSTINLLRAPHILSTSISTQIISGGAWSGGVIDSKYIASSSKYSDVYGWYSESSSKISKMVASGDSYSKAHASAQATKSLAYLDGSDIDGDNLLWDGELNVQDKFIKNSEDDTTTGTITAGGFTTTCHVSAQNISGGTIIGTWAGDDLTATNIPGYIASSTAVDRFADSSNYSTHKGTATTHFTVESIRDDFYPSSLGRQVSGAVLANTLHSANSSIHSFNVDSYMTSANIIANYVASTTASARFADSSNYSTHKGTSTIHFTVDSIRDDFYPSSLGKQVSGAVLANTLHSANSAIHAFRVVNYMTSANSIDRFADSSNIDNKFVASGVKLNAISSLSISGGRIKTDLITITEGTDGIQFVNANTKIYESSEDLYIQSEDDVIVNSDDNVLVQIEGTNYAQFFGNEKALSISNDGSFATPVYNLEVKGSISGTSITSDSISGNKISGGTIVGAWAGDSITASYITDYIASSTVLGKYYLSSIGVGTSGTVASLISFSSNAKNLYVNSGTRLNTISAQSLSGGSIQGTWIGDIISKPYISYGISGASDIDDGVGGGWDSTAFKNSGILWDETHWVPMPSGGSGGDGGSAPGGTTAGDIQYRIDASNLGGETNFNYDATSDILRLYHLSTQSASSQTISGGTIKGTWAGDTLTAEYITDYIASASAVSRFADSSQYSTDKVNFQSAYDWVNGSSNRYEDILSSGTKYTTTYTYINASGGLLAELLSSGAKYTSAYQSGQRVKDSFDETLYLTSSNLYTKFLQSGVRYLSLSSQNISGGTYIGNTISVNGIVSSQTGLIAHYVSANNSNITAQMGGTMVSNLDGNSYTYGVDNVDFVSSQSISGGTHVGTWLGDSINLAYIESGSNIYDERGSQIAGDELTWDGNLNVQDRFIRNDENDTTTGVITAAGFDTTKFVSSQHLSGQLIALATARDVNSWDASTFTNSGLKWSGTGWNASYLGVWTKRTGGIYYNDGEVIIGPSTFDLGDYKLQVAGNSYFSGAVQFIGEISGIRDPTYASGVASKHYVDNALSSSRFKDEAGILVQHDVNGYIKLSGQGATHVMSGQNMFLISSALDKYGWCSVANGGTFLHNYSSKPSWIGLSPSGTSPIAYSFTVDATNVTIYHTSPDSETFSWRAKL